MMTLRSTRDGPSRSRWEHPDVQAQVAFILEELQRRVVIDAGDRATALAPEKTSYLLELALTRKPARVLEIGLGWGFSAAGLQRLGCVRQHVIVEFDIGSVRATQAERNVRAITTRPESLEFCWGESHRVLPRLCDRGEQFDLIFIDGGHRYDDVFVDFHFSRRLAAADGSVVFDDTWLPSIRTVVSWVETNLSDQWRRLQAPSGLSLAAFESLGVPDGRRWDHFTPFMVG
jgi:predicted O-methyltransferase YrrM